MSHETVIELFQFVRVWGGLLRQLFADGDLITLAVIAWVLRIAGNSWTSELSTGNKSGRFLGLLLAAVFVGHSLSSQTVSDSATVFDCLLRAVAVHYAGQGTMQLLLCGCSMVGSVLLMPPVRFVRSVFGGFTASIQRVSQEIHRTRKTVAPQRSVDPVEEARRRQLEQQRQQQEAALAVQKAADRRRREDALLRCDLFYERYARQLAGAFSRERFEAFVERYMGENVAPELTEQREQLLKDMIIDSLGKSPTPTFASMTELAAFFAARRDEIEALPHDDDAKDAYRIQLNRQEDEALRKLLKP